ncbi:conserved Plasmodium protein, unknown function [Plasmodium gaboni]|uniref:Uncharacterized protein n=1 Tax=Plasmodium gaboni TaxID=647221 RepID=A0ABY1UTT6_9APIC|nr:conserved Plasmodium protein, unknown function [Plasmodium gaboni]
MRKYLCRVSFNVVIFIILFCHIILGRNNKTIKWISIEKDGKLFNHVVRYFIQDDKILKIYTINNNINMDNIDNDFYMNNENSLVKNNYKNVDNIFNNIFYNKVPLSFIIEMFYGYRKKEILNYSEMKNYKNICNKIYNLEEYKVENKCAYYLFRNIIYNFIPQNAFIKNDGNNKRVNNNMYMKNKREIPFKCSSYIFFLDNILSKNQKKKEECIYRMKRMNISYTYVEYEIKDTFENIFFDLLKYISKIMEANKNVMNLKNYDNKQYKMFIVLNNKILEKASKLKHISFFYNTLEEYIQSLDGINKIFAEDIIKEIMDIYSNQNNDNIIDNIDNEKLFLRSNGVVINRMSNYINYNTNNDIFRFYNDDIINKNPFVSNKKIDNNNDDYDKKDANKYGIEFLKLSLKNNMNDIKSDEQEDMLVLLNKYFFDFYIHIKRINQEYIKHFDVTYKCDEIKNVKKNKNKDDQLLRNKENEETKRKTFYTSFIKLKEKYMNEKINNEDNITNEYISGETINDKYVNMKHSNGELLNPKNSTDKIILNSMNVLKNITDKIKKENNFSHVDKMNEIDIPTVAEEERKIDDFYEYEKKTMTKIHENKENIYRMINEDLDILLKPAQDEYIKVARNIKNKLLQEYEQILKEQISDEEI